MHKRPSDFGIYIKRLEEILLSCFEQWKEVTAALGTYLGKSDCDKGRDLDCIDCFCYDMKDRLTELRRRGGHTGSWRFGPMGEPPLYSVSARRYEDGAGRTKGSICRSVDIADSPGRGNNVFCRFEAKAVQGYE